MLWRLQRAGARETATVPQVGFGRRGRVGGPGLGREETGLSRAGGQEEQREGGTSREPDTKGNAIWPGVRPPRDTSRGFQEFGVCWGEEHMDWKSYGGSGP